MIVMHNFYDSFVNYFDDQTVDTLEHFKCQKDIHINTMYFILLYCLLLKGLNSTYTQLFNERIFHFHTITEYRLLFN